MIIYIGLYKYIRLGIAQSSYINLSYVTIVVTYWSNTYTLKTVSIQCLTTIFPSSKPFLGMRTIIAAWLCR